MTEAPQPAYRVLARKYRPASLGELIGQEAMVRTLKNAIAGGRLAHAFMLTGVRGVGKTTTARIIARSLNCIGADGAGGPTATPCGVCEHCRAIAEDRHVDVLEMDAASHTGVADIREIVDGVRYLPASARFKVYIIDEVHMLSTQAFNALLKTLEEPPPRVKFVFATTEIRKIPLTVLSRCQRFDLRRVELDVLADYLGEIADREGAVVEPAALTLIARAAEGSVRDGLSLLDQAIAHGEGTVGEAALRDILGLADRARLFDLFDLVMKGEVGDALAVLRDMYDAGADPLVVVQDLLDLTHWLTRLKIVAGAGEDVAIAAAERRRGAEMAGRLSMAMLARTWQMLLKGLGEARLAPAPLAAAEMLLVRLAYVADLLTPAELIQAGGGADAAGADAPAPAPPAQPVPSFPSGAQAGPQAALAEVPEPVPEDAAAPDKPAERAAPRASEPAPSARSEVADFAAVAKLASVRREVRLYAHLVNDVHLVGFEPGRIEFRPSAHAPADLAARLTAFLSECTGARWVVTLSNEAGAPTLTEQNVRRVASEREAAAEHPLVKAALAAFPGAEIAEVRKRPGIAAGIAALAAEGEPMDADLDGDAEAAADAGPRAGGAGDQEG